MPKLLALLVCERVIIDRQGMPSLINVFQKMNIQLADAPLPEKAVSPGRWAVFSLWQHEESEKEKPFTQILEVIVPSGEMFVTSEQEFKTVGPEDTQSKISIEFGSLPIWQEGIIQVRVALKGSDEPAHVYKFEVKYLPKETNVESSGS